MIDRPRLGLGKALPFENMAINSRSNKINCPLIPLHVGMATRFEDIFWVVGNIKFYCLL